jgi:Ca2+-binding RTX toxin-like protein
MPIIKKTPGPILNHIYGDAPGQIGGPIFAGNQTLNGGGGWDVIYGDADGLVQFAKGGDDSLFGNGGIDTLYGDANFMWGRAVGGNDLLDGGASWDWLYGDAYEMRDQTLGGNDRLFGGDDTDQLYGDAGGMYDSSRGGNDELHGGNGDDVLYGDALAVSLGVICGNDQLFGDAGNDKLYGDAEDGGLVGGGNDRLTGGTGNDELWGNGGSDTFIFRPGDGQDVIKDYVHINEFGAEQDKIDLSAYGFTSFAQLNIYNAGPAGDGWATIELSPTDKITIEWYSANQLSAADFIL